MPLSMRRVVAVCFFCLVSACRPANPPSDPADHAMSAIHGEAMRAHMRFLSSGRLTGRAPGTAGYDIAAEYVAAQLEALGLKPAGVGGSWFQPIRLRDFRVVPEQTTLELVRGAQHQAFTFGDDFVTSGNPLRTDDSVEAGLVFVGYGVTAPELHYDDYGNVDVRGKIVVTIEGAPSSFPSTERAYFSDGLNKVRNAVARGAVGTMTILSPEDQQRYAWNWIAPQVISGGMNWLDNDGKPHDTFDQIHGAVLLSPRGAELLFAGAPKPLAQLFTEAKAGKSQAFALPVTARVRTVSRHAEVQSANIVATLPGSDPGLRNEYVVYTAHLDHLGKCPPVNGDDVCHGAADNASGVAAVLEIARAFASLPGAPRRSILFAVVTGEEKGLLGSDYFANNPTVPASAMVADVNLDGTVGLFYAPKDIVAIGMEHSTLSANVRTAAARLGYDVSPDPMPEEVFFIRSDNYPLVRQGIPAVAISDGLKAVDPKLNGEAMTRTWLTTVYHTPRDNMNQAFDFAAAAKGARLEFLVGYDIAQQAQRPAWNAGNFFGQKFAKKGK